MSVSNPRRADMQQAAPIASLSRARHAVAEAEFETNRTRLIAVYGLAAILPPLFGIWDVVWKYATPEPADLQVMLGARAAAGALAGCVWWRLRFAESLTRRELDLWLDVLAPSLSVMVAVLCLGGPGVHSLYPNATGLVACVYAFVPRRYSEVLASALATLLAFPATIFVAALFWERAAQELAAPLFYLRLGVVLSLLAGMLGLLVYASHLIWAMRREVFEARNIGRYRVRERLGEGGMGEVWRAFDTTLRRDVALKVLRQDHTDEVAVRRFEREVQATIALTHPHTVRVYDYGATADGLVYYAMELLEGESLAQRLAREGRLSCQVAVHLALSAARALAEAHAAGIVHRDVKPANLFITRAGDEPDFLKVLDFGVARLLEADGDSVLTKTGHLAGTPHYIAPEVLAGQEAGCAADVYALGVVLYQMLTGRTPYALHEQTPVNIVAPLTMRPVPPSQHTELPEAVEVVVMHCLEKDPEKRYPNGRALAAALAALPPVGSSAPGFAAGPAAALPAANTRPA